MRLLGVYEGKSFPANSVMCGNKKKIHSLDPKLKYSSL